MNLQEQSGIEWNRQAGAFLLETVLVECLWSSLALWPQLNLWARKQAPKGSIPSWDPQAAVSPDLLEPQILSLNN